MVKRLVKVAKELNVGTTTIVEHLQANGFEIDNKPTAKVDEAMYESLMQEFSQSAEIREQANRIEIGTRGSERPTKEPVKEAYQPPLEETTPAVEQPVAKVETPKKQEPEPEPEKEPASKPEKVVEAEAPAEEVKTEKEKAKPVEEEVPSDKPTPKKGELGIKVVGKVKLDNKGRVVREKKEEKLVEEPEKKEEESKAEKVIEKPREEKPVAKREDAPEKKATEATEAKVEEKAEAKSEAETEGSSTIRADVPTLKGLKILGKVDLPKKKKVSKSKPKEKKEGESGGGRRRRTRKTVRTAVDNKKSSGGGTSKRASRRKKRQQTEEDKQVSQKQIEDQIKATMARIQGGGGKKRQKLRREGRDRQREKQEQLEASQAEDKSLQLTEFVTVSELASLMDITASDVITTCMSLGIIVAINQRLDAEVIELVAEEFGFEVEFISAEELVLDEEVELEDDPADLKPRAPVVTVMGHVDHGKTSLLDYIRETRVVEGESGGITQHLGAYEVEVGDEKRKVTFLDTPGHQAFTAMRARGAKVTDIAVIVVAADDNVMPQTKEAISHAQAANVPIIFAINKVDKDGAQPERIKQELASMNLLVEDWGGTYQSKDISAKQGTNIEELLEEIVLAAELLELKANPDRAATGAVLEASLDKGRGYVAKVLVQNGTLQVGDPVVAGEFSGKVKAMFNELGKRVKSAGPSTPTLVLGLDGAPQAGEKFKEMSTEVEARQIASTRAQIAREQANRAAKRISLDEIGRRLALGTFKELNLIIKGDVDGSVEALADELVGLSIETIQVNVIHKAVGQIIESDVLLASASDAIIIGFQVRPSLMARRLAEREGVQIKTYSIIYEAIEEIKSAIEGMLEPTKEEKVVCQLTVRETYKISKVGTIAGCIVDEGTINRNTKVRIIRNGIVVYPVKEGQVGEISSLKRFKDDVKEVKNGMECGISIKNFNDIKVDDVIEGYTIVETKVKLEDVM